MFCTLVSPAMGAAAAAQLTFTMTTACDCNHVNLTNYCLGVAAGAHLTSNMTTACGSHHVSLTRHCLASAVVGWDKLEVSVLMACSSGVLAPCYTNPLERCSLGMVYCIVTTAATPARPHNQCLRAFTAHSY